MATKRQQEKERRYRSLLVEAMGIVEREGLEALTVHRLAREAGLTVGALYRYFASKDALYARLQGEVLMGLATHWEHWCVQANTWWESDACPAQGESTPELYEQVKVLFLLMVLSGFYLSFAASKTAHYQMLLQMVVVPKQWVQDEEAMQTYAVVLPFLHSLHQIFEHAEHVGALEAGDGWERLVVYWSSLQGVIQAEKLQRFVPTSTRSQRLGGMLCVSLLRGWGAEPVTLGFAQERYQSWHQAGAGHEHKKAEEEQGV